MPVRLCAEPSCPEPAHYRGRCQAHNRAKEQETNRAGTHIYSTKRWQQTRQRVLFEQPLCTCGQIAEHVDHIQPLEEGGDPWARHNLQGLCAPCHSQKTRTEQVRRSSRCPH